MEHGGFDFEVAAVVEEAADGAEDGGALDEGLADVGVHEEVDVALAVAEFGVFEAVELVGEGEHGLGEEGEGGLAFVAGEATGRRGR